VGILWGSRTRPLVLTLALCGPLVFAEEAAEDGPALDPLLGKVNGRVVGPGWVELAAAMGASAVVVGLVLGQDRPQMPLGEDQHPVGDLGPGGEHEPFRVSVRSRASGRDLYGLDASVCQDYFWHPTGVFAAGDARYRSIKRVASAVGDGATAVRLVHEYLSAEGTAEPLLPARR